MESTNLMAAWLGIIAGLGSGVVMGLLFHNDNWLGGYPSWTRRLVRLAHISFFGLAFINLAYAFSVRFLIMTQPNPWPGTLLIVGAISMPVVCYLAAWRKPLRHLFPIPILSLLAGVGIFIITGVIS